MSYTKLIHDGCRNVRVTYDKRLAYCPYGSAGVDMTAEGVKLYSYSTHIMTACMDEDKETGEVHCALVLNGDWFKYSATTRKHVDAFLKEYAPWVTYGDLRDAWTACRKAVKGGPGTWMVRLVEGLTESGFEAFKMDAGYKMVHVDM